MFFVLSFSVIILSRCSSEKKLLIKEINSYKYNVYNDATYNISYDKLYEVLYSIMSDNYSIARESQSRGYIESGKINTHKTYATTVWEYSESVSAEIIGRESPFRVSFGCEGKRRSKKQDEGWSGWSAYRNYNIENRLKCELYERVNNKIKLSPELQKKVDTYNQNNRKGINY